MRRIRAVLIDIDGVPTVSWKPLPGTVAALRQLRTEGFPLALSEDLTRLDLAQGGEPPVDVVLVGGAGPEFSYQALNQAFQLPAAREPGWSPCTAAAPERSDSHGSL